MALAGQPARGATPPTLASPICSSQVAGAPTLDVSATMTDVPGHPFGVAVSPDGRQVIVSLVGRGPTLAVLDMSGGAATLRGTVSLPGGEPAHGMALSHSGRYLAVTLESQTAVVSLPALLAGAADPVLGMLHDGGIGTIEAAFSADDRYVFVSDEGSGAISVFDLDTALTTRFDAPGIAVGQVPVDPGPVGIAASPDGEVLYATSEVTSATAVQQGALTVIDVGRAERRPADSVLAQLPAGCEPVRVALSKGGRLIWVTARGSDELLAFAADRIRPDPAHALVAAVRVGSQPVGVLLTAGDRQVLTANSARFSQPNSAQTISVVDADAALAGRPSLLGTIPSGAFPREIGYDRPTGQVLVTNFNSDTVETFPAPFRGHAGGEAAIMCP
jgi:DNA-binding beta-propeller fold protein YncE